MAQHQRVSVVWELLDIPEEGREARVVVDVDCPLRPFGAVPLTPPKGGLALEGSPEAAPPEAPRGHRLPKV